MRKKYKILKTLSAFTALASTFTPLQSRAQTSNTPSVELNFNALQVLKQNVEAEKKHQLELKAEKKKQEAEEKAAAEKAAKQAKIDKQKAEAKAKKEAAYAKAHPEKKPAKAEEVVAEPVAPITKPVEEKRPEIKAAEPAPKEEAKKPAKAEKAKETTVASPKPEETKKAKAPEKTVAEKKKETVPEEKGAAPQPVAIEENAAKDEKRGSGSLWSKLPFASKKEEPKPAAEEKLPAVVIEKDPDEEKPAQEKSSLLGKLPFASKKPAVKENAVTENQKKEIKENKPEPTPAIAQKPAPVQDNQKEIYDDSKTEEFIDQKTNKPAPENAAHESASGAPIKIEEPKPAQKTKTDKKELAAKKKPEHKDVAKEAPAPKQEAVETPQETIPENTEIVKPEPAKVEEHKEAKKEEKPVQQEKKPEKEEAKNKQETVAAPAETTPAVAEEKPQEHLEKAEKSNEEWQDFLTASKKKAKQLDSLSEPKRPVEPRVIVPNGRDSIVALKPADKKAKEAEKATEKPAQQVQEKPAEENKVVEAPAPKEEKPEDLKVIETNKIEPSKPETATQPQPEKQTENNVKVEDIPSPVVKKQESASLSAMMNKLPYFKENTKELKNDTGHKQAEEAETVPEIPEPHDSAPIPVTNSQNEEVKQPQKPDVQKTEEKNDEKPGIISKMLDKELVPTNPDSKVVISNNTEKKLNDAVDSKINSIPETPKVKDQNAIIASQKVMAATAVKPPKPIVVPEGEALVSITFDDNNISLSAPDKEKIAALVHDTSSANKRFKIMSYARGVDGEVNSARRISLQRAIAVRSEMIQAGIEKNRINVQAVGNNISTPEFVNNVNIYELK